MVRARDRKADPRARDERDVREMGAARIRIVQRPHLTGGGVVRHHRGDGVGHRAEMDGNVLRLRDHATPFVEERRRTVAPLLDVGREGRADEHRAHLLGDRAEQAAENLELDRHDRVSLSMRPSLTPTHPGGTQHVEPGSSTTAGPETWVVDA